MIRTDPKTLADFPAKQWLAACLPSDPMSVHHDNQLPESSVINGVCWRAGSKIEHLSGYVAPKPNLHGGITVTFHRTEQAFCENGGASPYERVVETMEMQVSIEEVKKLQMQKLVSEVLSATQAYHEAVKEYVIRLPDMVEELLGTPGTLYTQSEVTTIQGLAITLADFLRDVRATPALMYVDIINDRLRRAEAVSMKQPL